MARDYEDDDGRRSRRGNFATMDPERHREISRRGGEASHGGHGRDWEGSRSWGGRSRYETEDRDERGRFTSGYGRGSRYDDGDERRESSRRGFAAMDPEERSEIGRMGARARWGDDRGGDDRGSRYEGNGDRWGRSFGPSSYRSGSYGTSSRYGGEERDEHGRFTSSGRGSRYEDEDDRSFARGRGRYGEDDEDERSYGRGFGRGSFEYDDRERDPRGRFTSSSRSSPYYWDEDDRSSRRSDWSSPYDRDRFSGATTRSWRSYE